MKYRKKYIYFVLLLLMIVLIINPKDKRPSSSVMITETMDPDSNQSPERDKTGEERVLTSPRTEEQTEDESHLPENDTPEEETVSAISETPEEETASVSPETERPHAMEGIPSYKSEGKFPTDMVFASQESVELVSGIYEEIGFEREFQSGDEAVYDFYRQKFALILDGKVKIYDSKGNESLLYDRYTTRLHQIRLQGTDALYFFDMDGDGLPELCVQGTSGTYVCKYNADSDRYTEWWGTTNSGCMILGTRRMAETRNGDIDRLFLFDKDGHMERKITFYISYRYEGIKLYLVSVPDLEERVRAGQIPDAMKQQTVYSEYEGAYYLRVTEEQYEELIKGLYEAEKEVKKHQVSFSYFFDSED